MLESGTAVQFSPEILGLNAGIFRTVSDIPELNFGTIFGQSETKFLGLFLGSPRTDFRTVIGPCVPSLCVIAKKN